MAKTQNRIPVIVTTQHRGVFFGHIDPKQLNERSVTLYGCRNAMYWSQETGGFLGLASKGPGAGSKIGETAEEALLHDVTSVAKCSADAAKKWETWSE